MIKIYREVKYIKIISKNYQKIIKIYFKKSYFLTFQKFQLIANKQYH